MDYGFYGLCKEVFFSDFPVFQQTLPVLQIFQYLLFLFFQIFIFEYRKPINI